MLNTVEKRTRLYDYIADTLEGALVGFDTLEGVGTIKHEVYEAIYPYRHIVSRLLWIQHDADCVIDVGESESLFVKIMESLDIVICRDCGEYCSYGDTSLECPCCKHLRESHNAE